MSTSPSSDIRSHSALQVAASRQLFLHVMSGPKIKLPAISPGRTLVIGRGAGADVELKHEAVSRTHAELTFLDGRWMLSDLESRHGTQLNGTALTPNRPTAIASDDVITILPWSLRVQIGEVSRHTIPTQDDLPQTATSVVAIREPDSVSMPHDRMKHLFELSTRMGSAGSEAALAEMALAGAIRLGGFQHGAVLRPTDGEDVVELIARRSQAGQSESEIRFSRSLVARALAGTTVTLQGMQQPEQVGQSIVSLGIQSALCAPIMLGESVFALLYLDSRSDQFRPGPDAVDMCQMIARMYGLAVASLKQLELDERNQQFEREMNQARKTQECTLPPRSGVVGPIRYEYELRPGHYVAGDLFAVLPIDSHRTLVAIGDVTGHGLGPALLMSTAQACFEAHMMHTDRLDVAVCALNRAIHARSSSMQFISFWAGVIDARSSSMEFVDAGHGLALLRKGQGRIEPIRSTGDIPLGIDPEIVYRSEHRPFEPGDALVLLSDGAIEQITPDGGQIGMDRFQTLIKSTQAGAVEGVFAELDALAGGRSFSDDVTIAIVAYDEA